MKSLFYTVMVLTLLGCQVAKEVQVQSGNETEGNMIEMVPEGAGVVVYNKENDLLLDAEVYLNEALIPFDSSRLVFPIPSETKMPYDLKIVHPDYESFEDETMYYDNTKVFLLEKGDRYYWENGVKIPVVAKENEFYLMLFNEHTFSDEQRAQMDEEIRGLLSSYSVDISPVVYDNDFNEVYFRKLIFNENLSQKKLEDIYQQFSNYEKTQFFGPFMKRNQSQDYEALGLSRKLEIRFTRPISDSERAEILERYNLTVESTNKEAPHLYTVVLLAESYGSEEIINLTDALNNHSLVRYASNQLFLLATN